MEKQTIGVIAIYLLVLGILAKSENLVSVILFNIFPILGGIYLIALYVKLYRMNKNDNNT